MLELEDYKASAVHASKSPGLAESTALCHHFCAQGKIVPFVASSGIAAELLSGGRTSHSRFQIPLNLHQDSTTMITGTSHAADLMRRAALII